jgi:hypothetical protein
MDKEQLRELVANARIDAALNGLQQLAKSAGNTRLLNDVIQLKGRFNDLERDVRQNTISFDNANISRATISKGILSLIDELPNGGTTPALPHRADTPSSTPPSFSTGSGDGKVTTGTGDGSTPFNKIPLWIGGIAGLAMLTMAVRFDCPSDGQYFVLRATTALAFGGLGSFFLGSLKLNFKGIEAGGALAFAVIGFLWNPAEGFVGKNCNEPFSVTVFVHGKGGRQDMILRQQGKVIMDLAGERREQPIQGNGEAIFQNLPPAYDGKQVLLSVDFSEPYKPIHADSLYPLQPNQQIYLAVALQGLDRIHGTVIWKENPLPGVFVSIGSTLADTTDSNGAYEIHIPEAQQRKEQEVKFVKPGFKMQIKKAFPQTHEPLNLIMVKSK